MFRISQPIPPKSFRMSPVKITKNALLEIKSILKNKNIPGEYGLRIGIKSGGGCVGISYMLGFDKATATDDVYDWNGIEILIEKKHLMFLIDIELDYHSTADSQGFTFNKNSTNTA